MANVHGPLFSIEASGQFAKSLVFDRRGHVRIYKVPANPKTDVQGDQRHIMLLAQKAVSQMGFNARQQLKNSATADGLPAYRWHNRLVGIMAKSNWYVNAISQWNALTAAEKSDWDTTAAANGYESVQVPYAGIGAASPGQVMFLAALGYSDATTNLVAPTVPDGTNAATIASKLTS